MKLSKEKGFQAVAEWIRPCENHLNWSATSTHDGKWHCDMGKIQGIYELCSK